MTKTEIEGLNHDARKQLQAIFWLELYFWTQQLFGTLPVYFKLPGNGSQLSEIFGGRGSH